MNKNAKKKNTKSKITSATKTNISELNNSRNGGQIALRGYSYQFLYSCYIILASASQEVMFQLEGTEDIDCIKQKDERSHFTHVQLKYSVNKQNASFLHGVLENFLEAYLLDTNRDFKLVYDFPVAKGNLSKMFETNLDKSSRTYWSGVISDIKKENPSWNWSVYDFDTFISHLSYEKISRDTLTQKIENELIEKYEITTDNISLFANSIKVLCFGKMEQRAFVTKSELDYQIQLVKIDISKGPQNPAHSWIRRLDFSKTEQSESSDFYEGKKATPADIVGGLPIRRTNLEKEVINSINGNTVTVIKASSGQGKTTLALQVAYSLLNEYAPYQILWCDDMKEIGNIVQYFKARISLGEKILIIIDNLDNHFSKWNYLAQLMQTELDWHYKLLITSREIDWYNYSGDLSNIQSIKVIKPVLEEKDALEIFNLFKGAQQLHQSITSWQSSWNKIAGRQLLIEYVYLLTHGEMLSERVAFQMAEIGQSHSGKAKCEILRKVCFADICGIRLSVADLYNSQTEETETDFGELIKSMESEFLVHINSDGGYIEGLHPVRSKYVVDRLHEFIRIDNTAEVVIGIAQKSDIPILFSHLPEFNFCKKDFFRNIVDILWDDNDLSNYITAIQGLFSGCVMKYYLSNQAAFDDANIHGGLFIISTEICPFTKFSEFDVEIDTLDKMKELFADNKNIEYLCKLRDTFSLCDLQTTYVYAFCENLYKKLISIHLDEIEDKLSYATISEWIYNISDEFNLSSRISLDSIWNESERLSLECISTLMYVYFCENKTGYMEFVDKNLKHILTYLKHKTKSHKIYVDFKTKSIHIEYILRLSSIKSGNEQSVSRLKYICKTLPIFDLYCSDGLKPSLNILSAYSVPDDAHKEMPLRNIVIMFHQNFTSLWNKTIMSNYEFDTVEEWLNYWFDVRQLICLFADKSCQCIYKLLEGKTLGNLAKEVDQLREEFCAITIPERHYPKEDRPFEEKALAPELLVKVKTKYFQSIQNFMNQMVGFLTKDEKDQRLAWVNLTTAESNLVTMQNYFTEIAIDLGLDKRAVSICSMENKCIEQLRMCCSYYQAHSANQYFNKYQVKKWYEKYCEDELKKAEDKLTKHLSNYEIRFPIHDYTVDIARYYPIILDNFDLSSESDLTELLLGCISFADTTFDYLVVLLSNEPKCVNSVALQLPKRMFIDVKKAIECEDDTFLDNLTPPYPVEVTTQMLECFGEKYELYEKSISQYDEIPIGDIAEELWVYSKSGELLSEPEDAEYLQDERKEIRGNIEIMLYSLKDKLSDEDYDWLAEISNNTFSGKIFDDALLNEVVEHYINTGGTN